MEDKLTDGSLVEMGAGEAGGKNYVDSATEMMKCIGERASYFTKTYENILVSTRSLFLVESLQSMSTLYITMIQLP